MADRRPFIVLRDRASLFFRCENRNRGDAELSSNSKVRNLRKDARRATGATVIGRRQKERYGAHSARRDDPCGAISSTRRINYSARSVTS